MYSSSWVGRKTQASWKKGFLDVAEVVRRREWVGEGPISSPKDSVYWRIVNWSLDGGDALIWY